MRKVFKNIFILGLVVVGVSVPCIDMAFSATKKSTKKSSSTKKKSSSSNTKRAAKSSTSTKRAATSSSSSKTSASARRNSSSTTTSKKVSLSAQANSFKQEQQSCRNAFVSCMDAQIKDIIDKYTYLYDDDAVQAYLETGEPFRCLFYDINNTNLPQNMQVVSSCRNVLNEATISSFNIAQTDMNSLINQYSLYLTSAECSSSGVATLNVNQTAKTGICPSCTTYKTLNSFLSSNGTVNTAWKNYQALCKEKYLVEKYKSVEDLTTADSEYRNFVYENCSSRDVNDLYFSYNYYCDLRTSTLKNAIGVKTNYCKLSSEENNTNGLTGEAKLRAEIANVFGTTSSSEYYKEALRRLESGELKMVNFMDSNLYKQKIEGLGLETLQSYDISTLLNTSTKCDNGYKYNASIGACQLYNSESGKYTDAGLSTAEFITATSTASGSCPLDSDIFDASSKKCVRCPAKSTWNSDVRRCQSDSVDKNVIMKAQAEAEKDARSIYTDLGIERDSSLFSINVVPPLGSGLVFPSALFNKAATYCFDGKEKSIKGVSSALKETYKTFNKNKKILSSCKESYKDDLERYYLAGYWPKEDVEPASDGTYNADSDYEELDFMSAKKACDVYEQNLISVRNNHYANFDTQIKNYLEDALAGIIKNKIKDITTLANVATTLQKDDAERTLNKIQSAADRALARSEAETELLNLETEQLSQQLVADKQYMNSLQELKNSVSSNYSGEIITACSSLGKDLVNKWVSSGTKTAASLMEYLSKMYVKVDASGKITPYTDENYASLSTSSNPEVSCLEVDSFFTSSAYNEISSLMASHLGSYDEVALSGGSGSLSTGIYYVEVAGAGGGGGAGGNNGNGFKCKWAHGGAGGKGEKIARVLFIPDGSKSYTYSVGAGGAGGKGHDGRGGDRGSAGNPSKLTFAAMGISITANAGGGGEQGHIDDRGADGVSAGNGQGAAGGGGGGRSGGGLTCNSASGGGGSNGWVVVRRYR
ncbi:hypothetical protein HDR59_03935 [bacterium]|nr:hypothetical protein [bacterium]